MAIISGRRSATTRSSRTGSWAYVRKYSRQSDIDRGICLAAITLFSNEVKDKSALALSRDLGLSYESTFVLLHKLREALAEEIRGRVVGGEAKEAEIDGGYFGGCIKPANVKAHRRDRRLTRNQNGKRKVVVVVRERGGNSVSAVFNLESQAASSFARVSRRERLCMLTKQHHGITYMSVLRSRELTIRRHTASMARALTWLRNTSLDCAAPRSAFTTTSPVRISSDMLRSPHGVRTTVASRMGAT
jgi:hypothetical protein